MTSRAQCLRSISNERVAGSICSFCELTHFFLCVWQTITNSSLVGSWPLIESTLYQRSLEHTLHNISTPKDEIVQKLFFTKEMPKLFEFQRSNRTRDCVRRNESKIVRQPRSSNSGSNLRLDFLFLKCRREFNKAFSNLCRRPGRKTEHECRLEFRLHAKK